MNAKKVDAKDTSSGSAGGAWSWLHGRLAIEGHNADLRRDQVAVWFGRPVGAWLVRGIAGAILAGDLRSQGQSHAIQPGLLLGVAATRQWLDQEGLRPYLRNSFAFSGSKAALASGGTIGSMDLRIGVDSGWRIGPAELYGTARVFGGPVFWTAPGRSETGSDRFKFQVGVGAAYSLGSWVAFAEAVPLGEVGVTAGIGLGW